ncbi:hypothetical protein F4808DRAFT_460754 [Astrocystis sublimbata]|nr:hypothetical protein F4808DRAFT_460754 [Astrocystis sublimbata]
MENPPSYSAATTRLDWLSIVAAYIPASCWTCCCLVDRRFYHHFAPRLWQDPLVTVRQLGLHPNDDLAWYRRFIHKYATGARHETRCMVKSLDFRAFALRASGLYSTEASERAISESFKALPRLFPQLVCLLVDGHSELDPGFLGTGKNDIITQSLELLDLARCRQELTSNLFSSHMFHGLVYLDISYVPGSLRNALQSSLNPTYLPQLRILKAPGREVDDVTARLLFQTFRLQLWSLDLSDNRLTDHSVDALLAQCFSAKSFRSHAHFEVEGKVAAPKSIGDHQYGPFEFIQESSHSASFEHPERYFADPPIYAQKADQVELQEWQTIRSDGISLPVMVDAGAVKKALLGNVLFSQSQITPSQPIRDFHLARGGITHLFLNNNKFTAHGIGKLMRLSAGRLQHFECDSCLYASPVTSPYPQDRQQLHIAGMFGLSHILRPVFSSNLRSLRVHHSVVTQVPGIITERLPLATSQRLSETVLFKKISRVYPQRFVPDMNPRIASLMLTNIPAWSTGPIVERLTSFLDLVSVQQKAIKQAGLGTRSDHITILSGLRHLRLELNSNFSEAELDLSTGRDIDYDKLLDPGDDEFSNNTFSFFDDMKPDMPKKPSMRQEPPKNDDAERYSQWKSGRLKSSPYSETESHFINYCEDASNSWTGNVFSVPVWIGPGTIGPHAAVNEYMWNLQNADLRTHVGPATPDHVASGVPSMVYIFRAAWDAMVFPKNLAQDLRNSGSAPLRDVAGAIKEYRARTRGTAQHWDGNIELLRTSGSSRYHTSEYWR